MDRHELNLLNQPITGICSFGKYPICTDLDKLDSDIAVLGIPYDNGVGFLSGARLGPRRIREASTQYGRGTRGFYDFVNDEQMLAAPVTITDCGDADILHGDVDYSFHCIERAVRRIIKAGSMPFIMGGDHSVTIPIGSALSEFGNDICIIQFDAHLDWTDHVGPQDLGNGSPMRRMSEMPHIGKMVQIGLRGFGSGGRSDYEDARHYGSTLITADQVHDNGIRFVLDQIPTADKYYVTFDIDGLDISIAPGAASPLPDGLTYREATELLTAICSTGKVIGMDLVEVAPQYDQTGTTERIASLIMMHAMAQAMKARYK